MNRVAVLIGMAFAMPNLLAEDCQPVSRQLNLPVQLKTRGNPRAAKWGDVEKTMTRVREALKGRSCQLSFGQVFSPNRKDAFFPLIGNVLRTAPEESLEGAGVYGQDGERLGKFANRVVFEKKGEYSYVNYYFQFLDDQGQLQSSGNRLLVDVSSGKPYFLLRWDEIENRIAASGP